MARKIFLFISAFFFVTSLNTAQKSAFTIEDLYKIKNVGSQVISDDGSKIAFTVSSSDLRKSKSNTDIYLMNSDGSNIKQLTTHPAADYNPIWTSDSRGIYFVSTRSGSEQVYYLSLDGGEAVQITNCSLGVSSPKLSGDRKYFLFTAQVFPECGADENCNKKISDSMENGPVQAHLADSLFVRHWTEYMDGQYSHLFVYDIEKKNITDVTPGYFDSPAFAPGGSSNYSFSPDSKEIAFDSKRVSRPESSTNTDVWIVSADGTGLKNITESNQGSDSNPKYSPDGKYIAYLTQIIPGYESDRFRIALYDRKTGTNKIITESFDNWVNDFEWSNDSRSIYFTASEKGYQPLFNVDIRNLSIKKIIENTAIFSFALSPKNDFAVYNYSYVHKPVEIARFDFGGKDKRDLTFFNKEIAEKVDIRPAEQVWVKGADETPVHVFIVKPHNFDPAKKYPLVINVHGGPQMQWMDSFWGDWQVYPGSGYIVAYPNPHGSTGYGQKFTEAISGDWDGKVYEDVMKVTDYLESLPYVDKNRIGAMGWSYGGYFMNLLQAKTKRYKCLASMMSIYDLAEFKGETEELWFANWDLKSKTGDPDDYEKMSPSKYIDNFATPTLIITGEKDYRVPYTQSIRYFTDLQNKGIDSRLIIFKNDGHWPSGLKSMPLYYNSHLEWFHKYLGGDPAPWDSKKLVRNMIYE
ncbi:MAG: peptidase S9 [Ignavibacteriae bacterium HGW-Ignavibacteriae-3]|nr:MAG: peptidase S9 [Ignavibacteriae bacterium HGW-Ignavibacteriae-3]